MIKASIILDYLDGHSVDRFVTTNGVNKNTVKKCLSKLRDFGMETTMNGLPRPRKPRKMTNVYKSRVLNLECTKPSEHGYPDELFSYKPMTDHIRNSKPSLKNMSRYTVIEILHETEIRTTWIRYFVEKRDHDFEKKMATVLHVYREFAMINDGVIIPALKDTLTISFDDKPGV